VGYLLVLVAYHHGWHRAQLHLGKDLLVEVQASTHRVDRDVVEELRLTWVQVVEEFLVDLECLRTCEATCKNSE
jgi:hypothetical protein